MTSIATCKLQASRSDDEFDVFSFKTLKMKPTPIVTEDQVQRFCRKDSSVPTKRTIVQQTTSLTMSLQSVERPSMPHSSTVVRAERH